MSGNRLGEMRIRVRQLIYKFRSQKINDAGFTSETLRILDEFKDLGDLRFQDFGLVVEERQTKNRPPSETDTIWKILDSAEPRIRQELDHWHMEMSK